MLFNIVRSVVRGVIFLAKVEKRAWGKKGRVSRKYLIFARLVIVFTLMLALEVDIGVIRIEGCSLPNSVGDSEVNAAWPNVYRWCREIMRAYAIHGIRPEVLASIMYVESRGDPGAYSSSGAVGLMQVMPRDGKAARFWCVNGPCFADRPTISELWDPEFNIEYGARILAENINRTRNLRAALRSYGPANYGYVYADMVLAVNAKITG